MDMFTKSQYRKLIREVSRKSIRLGTSGYLSCAANRHILIFVAAVQFLFPSASQAGLEKIDYRYQKITIGRQSYTAKVPAGYKLTLLNSKLDGPRLFAFAGNGDLFVGSQSGNVYRLPPPYTKASVFIKLSDYPHSIAFRKNKILIAQSAGLYMADYSPGQTKLSVARLKLIAEIPDGGGHSSRTVAVGPDHRIYLSLGIAYNCTDQYISEAYSFADRRGGIMVLNESTANYSWQAYATGLRNPVGYAWHPQTKQMYAGNNGPDHLGYDLPPEYFSRIERNSFHGMPWYYFDGRKLKRDPCIKNKAPQSISAVQQPVVTFPARNAPMGVSFVQGGVMGKSLEHDAVVALHGSWAKKPGGGFFGDNATRRPPKIVAVRFDKGRAVRVDDLITGFQLENGDRWARPVGVGFGPDGTLYFTSDGGTHGLFSLRRQD